MDNNHETVAIPSRKNIGMFSVIQNQPVKLPIHIRVLEKNMNKEVSITDQLSSLFYLWGTSLNVDAEKLKSLNLNYRILASSGDVSWTIPFKEKPIDKSDITSKLHDIKPNQPLIALVEGKFPFPYAGKYIPEWPEKSSSHNPMMEETPEQEGDKEAHEGTAPEIECVPAKAIISGCAEMFKDQIILSGGNPLFFLNAIDSLTLGEELISIRSKGKAAEFIGQVSSGTKLFYKFFVVFFISLLWIVFGVFRVYMRKRRRAMYQLTVVNT